MRLLLLFVIGLMFGFGGGFLVAGGMGESSHAHDHGGHNHGGDGAAEVAPWEGPPVDLQIGFRPDVGNGLNLQIKADGFTFTPERVNKDPLAGSGHAHVYINGEKVGRIYGNWAHLPLVLPGDVVRVTLNADNHMPWGIDGEPIAAELTYQ